MTKQKSLFAIFDNAPKNFWI